MQLSSWPRSNLKALICVRIQRRLTQFNVSMRISGLNVVDIILSHSSIPGEVTGEVAQCALRSSQLASEVAINSTNVVILKKIVILGLNSHQWFDVVRSQPCREVSAGVCGCLGVSGMTPKPHPRRA